MRKHLTKSEIQSMVRAYNRKMGLNSGRYWGEKKSDASHGSSETGDKI